MAGSLLPRVKWPLISQFVYKCRTDLLRDMWGPGTGYLRGYLLLTSRELRDGHVSDTWEGESFERVRQAHTGDGGVLAFGIPLLPSVS